MKHLQFIGLIACASFFIGCTSTRTTGPGNQELKRMAALEKERQQSAEIDERQRNLWNAQHDIITRDGNASNHYY